MNKYGWDSGRNAIRSKQHKTPLSLLEPDPVKEAESSRKTKNHYI
jgi:hypothetical protein